MLIDNVLLDLKLYPLPLTWLDFQKHALKGVIEANSQKYSSKLIQ